MIWEDVERILPPQVVLLLGFLAVVTILMVVLKYGGGVVPNGSALVVEANA
jgi:hypothetical protein